MTDIERPALEGTVAVRDGRRVSFAEFGSPRGPAIIWMHGTPGSRRNVLSRPEFKAMFLDDLLNGSRFQSSAPLNDLLLLTRRTRDRAPDPR